MPILYNSDTNYYVITISPKLWKEFNKLDEIEQFKLQNKYDVKKGDIMFLYIRVKPRYYFSGIVQVKSNKNKIIKINDSVIFEEKIETDEVYGFIKDKLKNVNTSRSFQRKYLSKPDIIVKLPNCEEIIDSWLNDESTISEDIVSEDIVSEDSISKKEESTFDITSEESTSSCSDSVSKKEIEDGKGSSESDDSSNSEDDISDCDEGGQIPILLIPCKKFKWPKKNKTKYFKKHYKKCTKCEKNDNNDIPLISFIDDMEIDIFEITEKKDIELDLVLPYYYSLKRCPIEDGTAPYMRIGIISNGHPNYENCFIICYKIKN